MYAVIKTGGKQYRVENDQKLLVERIKADEGSVVTLSDILMVVDSGKITKGNELQNVAVSATVVKQTRGPKIITLKHRRRKNSRRVKGHRQDLTLLKVVGIGDPKKLVIKDEKMKTPPASSGALPGITREVIFEIADEFGIELKEAQMTRYDIYAADECFLTGTAAEVIAAVNLDRRPIGDGNPGPVTGRFISRFRDRVSQEGTPIG